MKKKIWVWFLVIIGVSVIATTVFFIVKSKSTNESGSELDETGLLVQKVGEQELGDSILVTGKVVPEDEQKVFLDPENGEVHEYLVTENQQVKAGDALFNYDSSKIDVEYNKAVRERDLIQKRAENRNKIKLLK